MDLVFCSAKLGGVSKSGEHPQSNSMRTFLKLVYFGNRGKAPLLPMLPVLIASSLLSFCQYQELEEAKRSHCSQLKSHQQHIEELSFAIQRWQCDLENMKKQVSWAIFIH